MNMRSILTIGLACTFVLGASSCGKKKKKQKKVAEDPVLESGQDLLITEIVPHASHDHKDTDGERPDWIELHNMGAETISLGDFALTDSKKEPLKWVLPDQTLEPGAFVTVFASGKDRVEDDGDLHSNFKLDNKGEYLALVRIEDEVAVQTFAPVYPKVPKGKSYGYVFAGGSVIINETGFFSTLTPGEPNPDTPDAPEDNS